MKNIILLTLGLFLNTSCAQNKPTYIDINQLSIKGINYQTSLKEIKIILGEPLKHKNIDDPEGEYGETPAIYDYFDYKGIKVMYIKYEYMDKKEIENIEIKSNRFPLKINNKQIKIGDDFLKIKEILPLEYNKFLENHLEIKKEKEYEIIGGNLKIDNLEPSNIVFTIKNGKVNGISIGFSK